MVALVAAALLAKPPAAKASMVITTPEPGALFARGETVRFDVRGADAPPTVSITDYWGSAIPVSATQTGIEAGKLPPGWYKLTASLSGETITRSFGVVDNDGAAPPAGGGAVCADAAAGWLIKPSQYTEFAALVRRAGFPTVRERLRWSDVETARGVYDWARYDTLENAYGKAGVKVDMIWHDTPSWALSPGDGIHHAPADLRDVYEFLRIGAHRWRSTVMSWEIWNEPDISFFDDLADRFAGMQKAAYLGLKAGNPNISVLMPAMATASVTDFAACLSENGAAGASDIFNWHDYAPPGTYAQTIEALTGGLATARDRLAWITEAGIPLPGTDNGAGEADLSPALARRQAQFAAQSVALSLAAGNARHFFFVLPDYSGEGPQYGVLHRDLTPRPALLALSAAATILGDSRVGPATSPSAASSPGIHAAAFTREGVPGLAIWADTPQTITLPPAGRYAFYNLFGAPIAGVRPEADGMLHVPVGPDMTYMLGFAGFAPPDKTLWPAIEMSSRGDRSSHKPAPHLVIDGWATGLPTDKAGNAGSSYLVAGSQPIAYHIEADNFDASQSARGTIRIVLPEGWTCGAPIQSYSLPPGGRMAVAVQITPTRPELGIDRVTLTDGGESLPSVSYFRWVLSAASAVAAQPLDWSDPALWKPYASSNGSVAVTSTTSGILSFAAAFPGEGDRWAYPLYTFNASADFSAWDAIACDIDVPPDQDSNAIIRMQFVSSNGSTYIVGGQATPGSATRFFLFGDADHAPWTPPSPTGRIDLARTAGVMLGLNTTGSAFRFTAGNFRLVRFAHASSTPPGR